MTARLLGKARCCSGAKRRDQQLRPARVAAPTRLGSGSTGPRRWAPESLRAAAGGESERRVAELEQLLGKQEARSRL